MYFSHLKHELVKIGIDAAEIQGCSLEEISALERRVGRPLPVAYRDFLSAIGRNSGVFLKSEMMFYGAVLHHVQYREDNIKWTNEDIIEEGGTFLVPDDAFFFADEAGEHRCYFRLSCGVDDPPVYYCGDNPHRLIADQFTEYIERYLKSLPEKLPYTQPKSSK